MQQNEAVTVPPAAFFQEKHAVSLEISDLGCSSAGSGCPNHIQHAKFGSAIAMLVLQFFCRKSAPNASNDWSSAPGWVRPKRFEFRMLCCQAGLFEGVVCGRSFRNIRALFLLNSNFRVVNPGLFGCCGLSKHSCAH